MWNNTGGIMIMVQVYRQFRQFTFRRTYEQDNIRGGEREQEQKLNEFNNCKSVVK